MASASSCSASAVPADPPPQTAFVLLALLEECHHSSASAPPPRPLPPLPSSATRSSSSSSSSSASFSSDSAIASSASVVLLSPPSSAASSSSSTAASSSSSSAAPPLPLVHVAHQTVVSGSWEPLGPVRHAQLHVGNALDELDKLAASVSERCSARARTVLMCSREALRQSLYPLCASALIARLVAEERAMTTEAETERKKKTEEDGNGEQEQEQQQEVQLFSALLPLPALFHAFVPFVPSAVSLPSQISGESGGDGTTPTSAPEPMESGGGEGIEVRLLEERIRQMRKVLGDQKRDCLEVFLARRERVAQGYTPAVCSELQVDSRCVVRARGLPWHVSDLDVAMFFAGLDIPPGGIALCLGPEGRRNGEALVRFARADHRELALQRHRRHLHARYIEVYRASGEEFIKHAVGTDSQAVRFALRAETAMAMIVRMRGLPFAATEQQVRDFFSSDGQPAGLLDQQGAVLFVQRPDGRPSGDAFVLFGDEQAGRRALAKHRQRMGGRYIELFRTTQAEVQQLFNARAIAQQNAAIGSAVASTKMGTAGVGPLTAALQQQQQGTLPATVMAPAPPAASVHSVNGIGAAPPHHRPPQQRQRDCLRLRGLPYEAQVQQVVEFLGQYARHVLFQGVHMIYNSAGHPSGEAFIQMESEQLAALAAQEMHNKYMELGKKKRYIEVFQCCAEDMSLLLNVLPLPLLNGGLLPSPMAGTPTGAPPPPLFSLPAGTFSPITAAGAPPQSPLLTAFPAGPPQFIATPFAAPNDPALMSGMLMAAAAAGQFAGPLAQLYAPPPDSPQFHHHSAPAELWLRGAASAGLIGGFRACAAPFAPPLIQFQQNGGAIAAAAPNGAAVAISNGGGATNGAAGGTTLIAFAPSAAVEAATSVVQQQS